MPFSAHEYNWQAPAWPSFSYDTQAVASALLEANRAHGYAEGKLSAVGLSAQKGIYADAWAQEALATAAIEGERLNLEAVQSSIARRLGTPQRKSTTTPRHVDGLLDIMEDALSRASAPLTHERLCAWQAALFPTGFSGLNKITVGAYRDHEEAMQIVSKRLDERVQVHYEAPPAVRVRSEMQALLDWLNQAPDTAAVVRAALAHLWFETIHPFEDGNGRVGRAVVDLVLARDAAVSGRMLRISHQLADQRDDYYGQLERASRGDLNVTNWVLWFIEQFRTACVAAARTIDLSLEKGRFWSAHSDQDLNQRQRKVINVLLDAGPRGFVGDMSTQKYQSLAATSRATASRELLDLQAKGLLQVAGSGRSTRYVINLPGWEPATQAG
jgi:Fic family protein